VKQFILYQYSDTVFAVRRFNDAKDGDALLFIQDYNARVTYLFAASLGELRHAADALRKSHLRHCCYTPYFTPV